MSDEIIKQDNITKSVFHHPVFIKKLSTPFQVCFQVNMILMNEI